MRLYYWKIIVGHTVGKANENTLRVATLQRANGYCADWALAEHTLAACTCFLLHAGHLATCLSFFFILRISTSCIKRVQNLKTPTLMASVKGEQFLRSHFTPAFCQEWGSHESALYEAFCLTVGGCLP